MMTANQIRKKYLDFFKSKGHSILASDSVVPKDDPTVLFTTAGMQQFKRQFLGHIDDFTKASTSQKCLRTDDLDKVGKTDFHHTFFEMLGNFSFGDYFKREAIFWAWEFLTKELQIPIEKLWVSVYKDDSEARDIWIKEIKVDPKKLVALGDKSNFWPSEAKEKGPNGPCGPCSEIFYDYGVNPKCTSQVCDPDCSCGRFCEVWNLVFTQFNRKDGGVLEPLPSKNIDTGMGFERLVSVMQGVKSNFDTDIFTPILKAIDEKIKGLSRYHRFVIADHLRAITFGISDGVIPSNEGRGYVIKKLIIDVTDIAISAGAQKAVIFELIDSVVVSMGETYPEIKTKLQDIKQIVKNIEESYLRVRKERIPELKAKLEIIKNLNDAEKIKELGRTKFIYRDTFGLTIPTIEQEINKINFSASIKENAEKEFLSLMHEQQQKSRQSSKMLGDVFVDTGVDLNVPKTEFVGYEKTTVDAKILRLLVNNKAVDSVSAGQELKVVLDKSCFYAESGGQVGDTGFLVGKNGKIKIVDTHKLDDIYFHSAIVEEGTIKINDQVRAEIDVTRRKSIMRNHTATHLLQSALRKVLGSHIQQQGSLVDESRLRFDFTHPKAITEKEIEAIEEIVNGYVLNCDAVAKEVLPIEKAKETGALAFFAEKYGKSVRVVSVGSYSKEFCGGTHLNYTGEIGVFKIVSESAIAQGIRRIEAKTGQGSLETIAAQEKQLKELSSALKISPDQLKERVLGQVNRIKNLEQELENFRFEAIKANVDTIIKSSVNNSQAKIITHVFNDIEVELLRKVSDLIKQKTTSSILVLASKRPDAAALLISVSDDLVAKGIKANELIKDLAALMGGSGGGKPNLAQAGSKSPEKIDAVMAKAITYIKEKVNL